MKKVPNLLKQAGNGIACALRVLFRLYSPDLFDSAASAPGDGGAAGPDQDSKEDAGALPPDEVQGRKELAEGCVL